MQSKVLGVFDNEQEVIISIKAYESAGADPKNFSVLARDEDKTDYITEEMNVSEKRPANGEMFGILGGFLSGMSGGMVIPGMVTPGIGPYMAAGPIASAFTGDSYDDMKNMFTSLGLDEESAEGYIQELDEGKIILFQED